MGVVEWGALVTAVTVLATMGRMIFSLADRLNAAEDTASGASIAVTALRMDIRSLETALHKHEVAVASNYVTKETLSGMESRLMAAITGLGTRIDQMLTHQP